MTDGRHTKGHLGPARAGQLEMSSLNYTADSIKKQSVTKIEMKQVMLQYKYTHVKRYKVHKVMLKRVMINHVISKKDRQIYM